MNYRHIYHAGNFADIVKHIVLCFCLEKLQEKDAAFFVLDTHAGIGKYDLADEKSVKTFEAENGIKKIIAEAFLPESLLKILAKTNCCEISDLPSKFKVYPGSPIIIKNFLRKQDHAIFSELHKEDFVQLRRNFAGNQKVTLLNENGFALLKSKLPPQEKRGLIIIDPAFERDQKLISDDYSNIVAGLIDAEKRFTHGIYLVWYPIIYKEKKLLEEFYQKIFEINFPKISQLIFDLDGGCEKMSACGMFIINAPWQLDEKLNMVLPKILEKLKIGKNAEFLYKVIR